MFVTLQLSADLAALLCGTLMRAADQYPDSLNQRELFERVEAAVHVAEYYCPDHKYNPPPDSGITLCPQCEIAALENIEEREAVEPCPCGKSPECVSGPNMRQVVCRRCGRRGPLAPAEDLAIRLWNNDHSERRAKRYSRG